MISRVNIIVLFFVLLPYAGVTKEYPVSYQAYMIVKTARKYHYSPKPVNNDFSKAVFESFFHMLDPYGLFFTRESIESLEHFKFALDNLITQQKDDFLQAATSEYVDQLHHADSLMEQFMNAEINFNVPDTLSYNDSINYSKQCDIKSRWEKWIKYAVLYSYRTGLDTLKSIATPTKAELQKLVKNVISRQSCRIRLKLNPPEGIQEFTGSIYLKAISSSFDPHSIFLSSEEKTMWETELSNESNSFGISINMTITGEIEIVEVLPGGPAWRSNKINEGDVILDIREKDGRSIDFQCATLLQIYKFLSSIGDKQSVFKIRKKNGKIIYVMLKKEVLDVENNTIRSYILKEKKTIGYIYLPSFYTDFNYYNYVSNGCANDLAKELIKLKNAGIEGLILDLRDNGGGLLVEAFRIAGVFIDKGSLSIIHSRGQAPELVKDNARGAVYDGPLIVLVNSSSASASELLAGVLQDYNRAVIVGSKTFGKATMQEMLPVDAGNFDSLSQYQGDPPGFINLTSGAFFRVTGVSHQKTGIIPDIALPELFDTLDREASYDGALEFTNINKKSYYYPADTLPVKYLKVLSDKRVKSSSGFNYLKKQKALPSLTYARNCMPLSFQSFYDYVNRFDKLEKSVKIEHSVFNVAPAGNAKMTDLQQMHSNTTIQNIKEDIHINESFNILMDLINISLEKEAK